MTTTSPLTRKKSAEPIENSGEKRHHTSYDAPPSHIQTSSDSASVPTVRPGFDSTQIPQGDVQPLTSMSPSSTARTNESALAPPAPQNSPSTGLIVGLVLSSFLLLLILAGIVLLVFRRWQRRKRSGSGPGSWSSLPAYWTKQSPSAPVFLSVDNDGGVGEVPPKSQFGLYMFKFKPPASAAVTRVPSSSPPATTMEQQALRPASVTPQPQRWFDASGEKPPRYERGDWVADPDSEIDGLVVRGYLPDTKEWRPPQGSEPGDHSSDWGTVPTHHAVESVPRI